MRPPGSFSIETRENWLRLRDALDQALAAEKGTEAEVSAEVATLLSRFANLGTRLNDDAMTLAASAVANGYDFEFAESTRIGPWEILRSLDRGGMGSVYLARKAGDKTGAVVALKVIRDFIATGTRRARFEREATLLRSLGCAGLPKVIAYGTSGDTPWMAMEYVDGVSISEYCERESLGVDRRLRLLIDLARIIAMVHERGVVHRDIKASNVLVDGSGRLKLVDFGLAKAQQTPASAQFTRDMLAPMTLESAAPEQFRIGGHITARTDIYQFGVLVYKLLTGMAPYRASADDLVAWGAVIANERPQSLRRGRRLAKKQNRADMGLAGVDATTLLALDAILGKAMAKRPFDRYASIGELANDLEAILAARTSVARLSGFAGGIRARAKRWLALARIGTAILLT